MNDSIDLTVLNAIASYKPDRPATSGDLWQMIAIQKHTERRFVLGRSLQRLKASGAIKYSRKPAGWVAT